MKKKLYILIREDLKSVEYKAVQAGHAVAQFLIDHPDDDWNNDYLIYVKVKDEERLKIWNMKLKDKGAKTAPFYEPDLNNQMTALASRFKDEKRIKLPLL